jgi:hypothetical protein
VIAVGFAANLPMTLSGQWVECGSGKFQCTASGNVGIGITYPYVALDVGPFGGAQTATSGAGGLIRNNAAADGPPYTQARIIVYGGPNLDTNNFGYLAYGSDANMRVVYGRMGQGTQLQIGQSSAMDGSGAFNSSMVVDGHSGWVGIGTISPTSTLDVRGVDGTTSYIVAEFNGMHPGYGSYTQYTDNFTYNYSIGTAPTSGDFTFISGRYPGAAGTERMRIQQGGNVGIGTVNPQYPLSVNGIIQAKEVLVNTGWSDYVFEPEYRLAPLGEVADYIRTNHHLPGIPSAAEAEEKGVSLGEMQSKLLAKIEELTLHMIEAEERSDRLERENRDLKEQNQAIQYRVGKLESVETGKSK